MHKSCMFPHQPCSDHLAAVGAGRNNWDLQLPQALGVSSFDLTLGGTLWALVFGGSGRTARPESLGKPLCKETVCAWWGKTSIILNFLTLTLVGLYIYILRNPKPPKSYNSC